VHVCREIAGIIQNFAPPFVQQMQFFQKYVSDKVMQMESIPLAPINVSRKRATIELSIEERLSNAVNDYKPPEHELLPLTGADHILLLDAVDLNNDDDMEVE